MPEDEWEEKERREEAFRREIATLKSLNRELSDFTGQIAGGFASGRVERPLLSVIYWSTATCEAATLAKALLVPGPRLVCHAGQSVLFYPGASQSPLANGSVCTPPVPCAPFQKRGINRKRWQNESALLWWLRRKGTLSAIGPPLAGKSGKW